MLDLDGQYTFTAPQEAVWNALQNPKLLGTIIPTCWGVESAGKNKYTGILKFQAGQMSGVFEGIIELTNIQEPDSYDISVTGKAPIGITKVTGGMRLEAVDKNNTIMHYSGTASFGGRIASVGSRILEMAVNAMINQSLVALNRYLVQNQ